MGSTIREPSFGSQLQSRRAAETILADLTCNFGTVLGLDPPSDVPKVSVTSKSWWRG